MANRSSRIRPSGGNEIALARRIEEGAGWGRHPPSRSPKKLPRKSVRDRYSGLRIVLPAAPSQPRRANGLLRLSSPLTATGSRRLFTGLPDSRSLARYVGEQFSMNRGEKSRRPLRWGASQFRRDRRSSERRSCVVPTGLGANERNSSVDLHPRLPLCRPYGADRPARVKRQLNPGRPCRAELRPRGTRDSIERAAQSRRDGTIVAEGVSPRSMRLYNTSPVGTTRIHANWHCAVPCGPSTNCKSCAASLRCAPFGVFFSMRQQGRGRISLRLPSASLGGDLECGGRAAAFDRVRRFIAEKPAQAMLAPFPIRPLLA